MVHRMNDPAKSSRRAQRLSLWYPSVWRERYGAEFVDLMEQEIDDRPHSFKRSCNIAYRGSVARLREVGLATSTMNPSDQPGAALATLFVSSAIFSFFALYFWSNAMLTWNVEGRAPASLAVTLWTGALTVLAGFVLAMVVATFGAIMWSAGRRIAKGGVKELVVPLSFVVSSVIFLAYSLFNQLRYVVARGGIDWAHPGQAIKQLAGVSIQIVATVNWVWMNPRASLTLSQNYFDGLIPVVFLVLAIAVAVLARRVNFSATASRPGRIACWVLAWTMGLFVVGYVALIISGGVTLGSVFGAPPLGYPPLVIEFATMVVMAAVAFQTQRRLTKNRPLILVDGQ
jgi:hypothetical protein